MGTAEWAKPDFLPAEELKRQFERREFLMLDGASVELLDFDEDTFKENQLGASAIYTSAQASAWGTGGGPPAVLASGLIGVGFESNSYNVAKYIGGNPFTSTAPTPSDYTVHQTMEYVPESIKQGLMDLSPEVVVRGSYKQKMSNIEEFIGPENVGGGFIWHAPVSPGYYYTDLMKGFDIGDATEICEEEYEVAISFAGQNSKGVLDPGLDVVIKSVETWGQIYYPYLDGSNTETSTNDQSARWKGKAASQGNHYEETVKFAGKECTVKISGLSAVTRVVYPDEDASGVGFSLSTNLVAGLSGMHVDKLVKVTASVSGFDAVGWIWLHLTPTLFAASRSGGPEFFPSWMKIDGAPWS
jgi:hypothetical protein